MQETILSIQPRDTIHFNPKESLPVTYDLSIPENSFCSLVKKAKEYIRAGDIFQVVLSNSLQIRGEFDATLLHDTLKYQNPSPYHFLFQFKDAYYVGASPEVMLRSEPVFVQIRKRVWVKSYYATCRGHLPN